ncbi:MAG: insulinase family protein [Chitinophagaceae bacterium]|nr:insulinase family protein [Chitinophagaceae bacterium]
MRMKILILAAAGLFCLNSVLGQARLVEKIERKGNELIIPYSKYVLPNGLTVIITEDHSDPIVHVDVTYHVGSAREEIGKSGFAHFFEHMMFEGSDHVKKGQHFGIITDAGGTLNGSTNTDRTNYYETVPSNQLEKMLWLESDRMGFLLDAVTQEKFENQRSTVKNERGQNYDNRPYGLVREFTAKNLYPYGHPYSWLTIGYIEDLNRVNVNDLKNFFLRWYGPNNATLTIGGDVNTAEVIRLVEKYFSSIPKGPAVEKTVLPKVELESDRYVSFTDNYARIPQMSKAYTTVPDYHADQAALSCLAEILGRGKTSILYQELVKTKKALNASAFSSQNELAGEFSFSITPYPGKSLASMDSLLKQALASFEARGVTDEDIDKFKGSQEAAYVNRLQSISGKVSQLAAFQTYTGNPNMISILLERFRAVTKEDVWRVYNEYIKGKHNVTVSVLTKAQDKDKDKWVAAPDNYLIDPSMYKHPDYGYNGLTYTKGKDNFDRTKIPGNGPNPVVKVPPFWKKDLPNGIKMIGTMNAELPTVTLSISIPGGHLAQANDTAKIGLAGMVASMMGEDTKNYSAEQLSVELQKLGSNISFSNDLNSMNVNVQCLKKNLDKTIDLLQERLFNPKFTPEAFDRLQKQALERFKQTKSQPATIATEVYNKINYGPYNILGMSDNGTEYTIRNLTLADVQKYYNDYMTSQGTKVVVVGDITENEILPKLAFLDKLPNKKITLPKPEAVPAVDKTKIFVVDVPKGAQTEFRVGYVTGLKYDATGDYYKAGLMNFALGGSFNSRLNMNLREEKGWTYGARSSFSGDEFTGNYTFSSGIRADATDSALAETIKDIREYAEKGITDEELTFTKNAIGQRDALQYETGVQKAGFIRRILDYNLPGNFVQQQNKILAGLTKKEMAALSKKWLVLDKMNILLVDDKAKILPGIQKLGYEIVELDVEGNKKDMHFK